MNNKLFVYGTLQIPEVLERIIGRRISGEPAVLQGYRRGIIIRANFPGVVAEKSSEVHGLLLRSVANSDFKLLDRYEGELYQRVLAEIWLGEAKKIQAWVYVISRWAQSRVSSQDWSIEQYLHENNLQPFSH